MVEWVLYVYLAGTATLVNDPTAATSHFSTQQHCEYIVGRVLRGAAGMDKNYTAICVQEDTNQ